MKGRLLGGEERAGLARSLRTFGGVVHDSSPSAPVHRAPADERGLDRSGRLRQGRKSTHAIPTPLVSGRWRCPAPLRDAGCRVQSAGFLSTISYKAVWVEPGGTGFRPCDGKRTVQTPPPAESLASYGNVWPAPFAIGFYGVLMSLRQRMRSHGEAPWPRWTSARLEPL